MSSFTTNKVSSDLIEPASGAGTIGATRAFASITSQSVVANRSVAIQDASFHCDSELGLVITPPTGLPITMDGDVSMTGSISLANLDLASSGSVTNAVDVSAQNLKITNVTQNAITPIPFVGSNTAYTLQHSCPAVMSVDTDVHNNCELVLGSLDGTYCADTTLLVLGSNHVNVYLSNGIIQLAGGSYIKLTYMDGTWSCTMPEDVEAQAVVYGLSTTTPFQLIEAYPAKTVYIICPSANGALVNLSNIIGPSRLHRLWIRSNGYSTILSASSGASPTTIPSGGLCEAVWLQQWYFKLW